MPARALTVIAALLALALIPSSALAAPKKIRIGFSSAAYSVNEPTNSTDTTFNVTVVRAGNTRVAIDADYSLDPSSTATPGTQYGFTPGTLHFAVGETKKTFPVTVHHDGNYTPPNKKVVLKLSNFSTAPSITQQKITTATLTILDSDGPGTIDFSSASYSVVESAGVATVTVTRNTIAPIVETVDYTTTQLAPGTGHASSASDYTTTAGTITFGSGELSKSFQVPVSDDNLFEGDETLSVTLSNPQNLTVPLQQPGLGTNTPATLTIADDDVPTFSFTQPTYSVQENAGTATISVTRGGATNVAASIDYSDDGTGTAIPTTDYTLTPGTLNFAAGETTKTFAVTIVNNGAGPEPNKTIGLQLKQGTAQVSTATLSIIDEDSPTPSVQFSSPAYSVNESQTAIDVTVTLSKQADGDVTVHYATGGGTATAGSDYTNTSGTLTFLGKLNNAGTGETSHTIHIPLSPDTVNEGDETFDVTLSANTGSTLGSPNPATVTIADDDTSGTLEFSSQRYDVNETGDHARITVNRIGGSSGDVSVDYATSDGTAAAPADYTTTAGTLSFADGETQKTFDIPVAWDGRAEGDETVSISLSNFVSDDDSGAAKAAVLHIADDGASGPVQFSAASYDVSETGGNATITVNRSGGSLGGPVTVDYAGSDGTHGTLTFGDGVGSQTFQVPVVDDSVHTGTRTVNLSLSNPGGGTSLGSPATAALNIADDEPASSASTDKTAPKLKLTAKKLQKALKTKKLVLKVGSNEAASLKITLKFRKGKGAKRKVVVVKRASKKVGAGKTVKVTLKLNKKQLKTLSKALVKGKLKVTLSVKGTDAAKNSATVSKTVTVK